MYSVSIETPRFGVMVFENSAPTVVSFASGLLICETDGSESSSATNGSSIVSVAGKKRLPAKTVGRAQDRARQHGEAQHE